MVKRKKRAQEQIVNFLRMVEVAGSAASMLRYGFYLLLYTKRSPWPPAGPSAFKLVPIDE